MGVVYRATDTRLKRDVALKVLPKAFTRNRERLARFEREARLLAQLQHPNIASIHGLEESGGVRALVMELVEGENLAERLQRGPLPLDEALAFARQIAEALEEAHEKGIVHRDLKPANIAVTAEGKVKVLDFGLAKAFSGEASGSGPSGDSSRSPTLTAQATGAGVILGTLAYMSPEQARGKELDPRSDIFSLGIVLYEMVTSELPFKGDSPLDTMHAIAYEEARPVTIVRRNLTPELHRIVFRCLRKRPEDRYPDARALAEDLRRLKRDVESGTRTRLPAGERLRGWIDWLRTSFPFGTKGLVILGMAIVLTAALVALRINWGGLIGPAFLALFGYRFARNRKKRLIAAFIKKAAKVTSVRAVFSGEDRMTVVMDKAPAKDYIRTTALIEEMNSKLYVGKRVAAEILPDPDEGEFQVLLRKMGIVYAREDVVVGRTAPGKTA